MKKILIVDDDPDIVELIRSRLEANHYQVSYAYDGKEGINRIRQFFPDLIIMDIMMPHLQGGEAVKILKEDPATKNIPIIFLTAVTSNDIQSGEPKWINVDETFYVAIAKPFESEKLLFEIDKLIGKS